MKKAPFYRLKELILEKYGERNFETGCELVARWLRFETKTATSAKEIKFFCELTCSEGASISLAGIAALKKLFKLKSPKELFTFPENKH